MLLKKQNKKYLKQIPTKSPSDLVDTELTVVTNLAVRREVIQEKSSHTPLISFSQITDIFLFYLLSVSPFSSFHCYKLFFQFRLNHKTIQEVAENKQENIRNT
ncbi:hypothetical protein XENORESO_013573 [Xenotaenia resolanae]|uniref:Uncharacterized protein n=1 Tax=Xenotaenia resolanae TaxID=208358 RepID=A0ABV0WUI7_9TELE